MTVDGEPHFKRMRERRPDDPADESLFVAERDTSRQVNPEDVAVAEAIAGKILALGRRGGNPVCRIKQRARVSRAR